MADKELTVRDLKLVQYLTEAYAKERQLETALQAHIGMTNRAPYKKRLQQHLSETRQHAKQVERQIKKLGGAVPEAAIDTTTTVSSVFGKALALAQGPLHAMRGTSENEKLLKNAKDEYVDESAEIAAYTAIETLATDVGDTDTARLARTIRRDEERMAGFLAKQIPTLTKAVVRDQVPANERQAATSRRRRSAASARRRSSSTARSRSRGSRSARATRSRSRS
jgi:ferritin-like metal-binding protein YciE